MQTIIQTVSGSIVGFGMLAFLPIFTLSTVLAVPSVADAQVAPTCSLSLSSTTVAPGTQVTLSWSTTNAYTASITTLGSVAVNTTGSFVVTPTYSQNYVLTVNGQGGSVNCVKYVTVDNTQSNEPKCTLSANPILVDNGVTTFTWTTQNASYVELETVGQVATNGSYTIGNATSERSYKLTATGTYGGTRTCSVFVKGSGSTYNGNVLHAGYSMYPDPFKQNNGGYTQYYYNPVLPYAQNQYQNTYQNTNQYVYSGTTPQYYTQGGQIVGQIANGGVLPSVTTNYVPLSSVPYTGAEDMVLPFFALALIATSAFGVRKFVA
jgi:hypothetical protein